jgi:hypothetical protein
LAVTDGFFGEDRQGANQTMLEDALEIVQALRAHHRRTPILIVTVRDAMNSR